MSHQRHRDDRRRLFAQPPRFQEAAHAWQAGISGAELALLKKLDYPCSEAVLASATLIEDEGFELTGTKDEFESLAGFAAGDANHCRANAKRRQQLLYNICEALEPALGCL